MQPVASFLEKSPGERRKSELSSSSVSCLLHTPGPLDFKLQLPFSSPIARVLQRSRGGRGLLLELRSMLTTFRTTSAPATCRISALLAGWATVSQHGVVADGCRFLFGCPVVLFLLICCWAVELQIFVLPHPGLLSWQHSSLQIYMFRHIALTSCWNHLGTGTGPMGEVPACSHNLLDSFDGALVGHDDGYSICKRCRFLFLLASLHARNSCCGCLNACPYHGPIFQNIRLCNHTPEIRLK